MTDAMPRLDLKLTDYIPDSPLARMSYVATEGMWAPDAEGRLQLVPFQFAPWEKEELSWYDGCYIHAGLNPFIVYRVIGRDFPQLLTDVSVNTFRQFPVGKARHTILCNNAGKLLMDGIVVRRTEDEFLVFCLPDPAGMNAQMGNRYDIQVENLYGHHFFYQLCGPTSLQVVERAAQKDLHDLRFMWSCPATIAGHEVMVLRTSMAGTLGYEVHGAVEDAAEVYESLVSAGDGLGIQPLGRHAYRNAHTEGSIPQMMMHFAPAPPDDARVSGELPVEFSGSLDPSTGLIFRSPIDCGWEGMIRWDHDFPGKEALAAELAGPHRTAVTLVWNVDDCLEAIRGAFDAEDPVDTMDMVEDFNPMKTSLDIHTDAVYVGDELVGCSNSRMLSAKTRQMISLGTIDTRFAHQGDEVEVLWGNPGTRQVRIRATVDVFPYIKEGRNEDFDTETIPHPVF